MIKVDNLSLSYNNKKIFENISFIIPDNRFTVFIGANGTGKTSIFKLISENCVPEKGVIKNTFRKTYFLPQKIKYPDKLTLYEYVTSFFYADFFKWYLTKEEKNKTEEILNLLEIEDKKNIMIESLSSGELQKANIATALLSDADCLLLDEPTSNTDLINQIKILEILKKLKNYNITCSIIIHDLNAAAAYGDYFIGIDKKQNIITGEKQDFFTSDNLEKIFGIKFDVDISKNKIIPTCINF